MNNKYKYELFEQKVIGKGNYSKVCEAVCWVDNKREVRIACKIMEITNE